jgi:SPP1 family predicted phage head-tail adaptor
MSEGSIKAGMLRHRVRVEKNSQSTRNAYGEMVPESWTTVATVWADVRPVAASETPEADRVEGRVTHKILTHHRTDITPEMRVVWIDNGAKVLQITDIRDIGGQHRGMQIHAVEVAA